MHVGRPAGAAGRVLHVSLETRRKLSAWKTGNGYLEYTTQQYLLKIEIVVDVEPFF